MKKIIDDLWFKRRDIISDGFDESLNYISDIIPLKIHKYPTGTECWTWIIPEKWSINQAYIEDSKKNRLLDLRDHPLHILSYSKPIDKVVSKEELFQHLHSNPKSPNAIPFEFKYYEKEWGFCIQHNKLEDFKDKEYRVFIDSKFEKGSLKVGEYTIPGERDDIIILMAHLCHPCLVDDDLTGVAVLIETAKEIAKLSNNHFTYKILFVPETIGSIAYLSHNEDLIPKIKYGIFYEMLGNSNTLALQHSRDKNSKMDRIARYVMNKNLKEYREGDFNTIVGNDEFVFNSPGLNIPMISINRFPYPEYHTSADTPEIITMERLTEAKENILEVIDILEKDYIPKQKTKGPIFLLRYGLWVDYRTNKQLHANMENITLNLEGKKSVFDISEEFDIDVYQVYDYVDKLYDHDLIEKLNAPDTSLNNAT